MDIWIIRNGEKTGPIHDYEVRHKIEDGELSPDTPAWHEGLDSWKSLGEIDLFKREFDLPLPVAESPSIFIRPLEADELPTPPVQRQLLLGRRFWARWFDLCLYSGIWWILMWATGRDIRATLSNLWIMFPHYVPWFILEAFLIHHFGTTPGKWLLGLRVANLDDSKLTLGESTRRSARVLFTGIGFGWQLLTLFCQLLSYFTTKRIGCSLWDHVGGHKLVPEPLRATRIIAFVLLFIGSLMLQTAVVTPYMLEAMAAESPEFKAELEKNPLWHPPKHP